MNQLYEQLRSGLIASCQALPEELLHGSEIMACVTVAAWRGGAVGIRANGLADIRAIRASVPLLIIGLYQDDTTGVYITPTVEHARAVAEAGADIMALDRTQRPRPDGKTLAEVTAAIHSEFGKPVQADVSTLEEGLAAEAILGVGTTSAFEVDCSRKFIRYLKPGAAPQNGVELRNP
jgi:N-acylglucosamine-6-phosphate 2-epimerase